MEAGRLKSAVDAVVADNSKLKIVDLLVALETAYAQSVQSPSPKTAQNFNSALAALAQALDDSYSATLSAGRVRVLQQINAAELAGRGLAAKIESLRVAAQSPAELVSQLQQLRQGVQEFTQDAAALSAALDKLGIIADDPPEGNAEIEIAIPASLMDEGLAGFAKEAKRLDQAISNLIEVATGSRPPLRISGLGTGSVEVYVTIDPVSGIAVLALVTAIINLINSVLQTRKTKNELEGQKAPKGIIESIVAWERARVDEALTQIADDLAKNSPLDKQRKTELRKVLGDSVHYLADRLDRGLDIDVTTTPPAAQAAGEGESPPSPTPAVSASLRIAEAAGTLARLQRGSEPTLMLPPPKEESETPKEVAARTKS